MGYQVPERVIKLLCGSAAFDQGAAYYHAHKVDLVYTEHNGEEEYSKYRAEVHGLEIHEISLIIDSDGDVQGECTCPAYYHGGPFCKHIAAALVTVLYRSRAAGAGQAADAGGGDTEETYTGETDRLLTPRSAGSSGDERRGQGGDRQLVSSMLGMFTGGRSRPSGAGTYIDLRTPLQVEFICRPFSFSFGSTMLGIEVKLGPKRLYIVQKIRAFLEQVHRGEPFEFTAHFSYDPALHSFSKENNEVLQKLIEIMLNEKVYRSLADPYASRNGPPGNDRLLPVAPFSGRVCTLRWKRRLPSAFSMASSWWTAWLCQRSRCRSASSSIRHRRKATGWMSGGLRSLQFWRAMGWC